METSVPAYIWEFPIANLGSHVDAELASPDFIELLWKFPDNSTVSVEKLDE
jgi:hypothetical protein